MFTGIIIALGRVVSNRFTDGDSRMAIDTGKLTLDDTQIGDSISVNGVCLTVVELGKHHFSADVSAETQKRTTLGKLTAGCKVNLEMSLTPSSKLGGHFVTGHIDGVGEVIGKQADGRSVQIVIRAPDKLARYIAEKGSICVDGTSLTVNGVRKSDFSVNVIPHTLSETTLGTTPQGARVNLEVDLLARYLERLVLGINVTESRLGVTMELLNRSGFINEI